MKPLTPDAARVLLDWLGEDESSKSDDVVLAIRDQLVPLLIRASVPAPEGAPRP